MTKQSQQPKLDFGPEYPKRPKFWFARAIRLMSHYAVAQEVGLLGYAVLIEVALSEDKRRYAAPPKWFKIALAERLDRQVEAISDAIQRCVDHGWLVWHQPSNKTKATTWVTIPTWVDDSAIDEQSETYRPENPVYDPVNHPGNHPAYDPVNHPGYDPRSNILTPTYKPAPAPKNDWTAAAAAVGEYLTEKDRALAECQKHALEPSDVLALVEWWKANSGAFRKPFGALDYGLRHATPSHRSDWSRAFPAIVTRPAPPAVVSRQAADDSRERDRRLRQLEMDFGQELKELTTAELIDRYALPDHVRGRLRGYPTWRSTDRSPEVRRAVLEFLEAMRKPVAIT